MDGDVLDLGVLIPTNAAHTIHTPIKEIKKKKKLRKKNIRNIENGSFDSHADALAMLAVISANKQ